VRVNQLTDGTGNTGMSKADLAINFDSSVFTVAGSDVFLGTAPVDAGPGWTATTTVNGAMGLLFISLTSGTAITSAGAVGDSLVNIDFHVQGGAAQGTSAIHLVSSNSLGTTDLFAGNGTQYTLTLADGAANILPAGPALGSFASVTSIGTGNGIGTMLLLTDGSVLVDGGNNNQNPNWYRLIPDTSGTTVNYAGGSWHTLTNSFLGRLYFGSVVMQDGKVMVLGGEFDTTANPQPNDSPAGEIFTPPTTSGGMGSWQKITSFPSTKFGDGSLELMNDGTVLAGGGDGAGGLTERYNPTLDPLTNLGLPATSNPWSVDATQGGSNTNAETGWTKLPDGSILTYQLFGFSGPAASPQTGTRFVIGSTSPIASAVGTATTPITITTTNLLPASLTTNSTVTIAGVQGFAGANGVFQVTVTGGNTFTLNGSTGAVGSSTPNTGTWAQDQWLPAGNVPVPLGANGGAGIVQEMGPSFLLPDGRVFEIGASGNTALYSPPALAGNATGTWVPGPVIPNGDGATDAPGAMMKNGDVLFAASPYLINGAGSPPPFQTPTRLYEYNPTTNTITQVPISDGTLSGESCFVTRMLDLPNGQVLFTDSSDQAYVYSPNVAPNGTPTPLDAWRPVIKGIRANGDGSFTLSGTQLTGISEGATYGDDAQMASNYPIVELTDSGGHPFFATTTNWSSAGVQTGSTLETVQFTVPAGHSLSDFPTVTVIANGIPSNPASLVVLGNTDENVTIRVNPGDSTKIQVLVTGTTTVVATSPNNSPDPIIIVGDANNNSVTVDETYGVVNAPIGFDGGGSPGAPGDQMIVIGTSGDDTLNLTPTGATSADMTFDASRVYSFTNIQQFSFDGEAGNDTLTVDSSTSLLSLANGIQYDGGTGFDTLQLVQTGGTTQTSDNYSPGPNAGEGTDVIAGPSGTQTVSFQHLAPVLDLVPASVLTVNGTPANNAISYTPGLINPFGDGLVTVDNFESIEFANKVSLDILSGLGTDTISLNNANTPTSLTGITVIGGDPSANDALFVTGVASTVAVDTFGTTITGATGAGGTVPISYGNIKNLSVTAGASTTLAIGGSTSYVYTPGTAADAGNIQTDVLPISFSGFGAGTTLALTGIISSASLVVNGTTANDVFTVAATTGNVTLAGRTTIAPTSIASLTVNGLDGGDTFNVTGPQPYASITLGGGGALAGDVANLTGDGTAVTANLGGTTASVTGGDLGSVSLPGIETLNLNAGSGAITLLGTPGPDAFIMTPTGANTSTAQVSGLAPTVNVTTTASLSVNGGGGTDALTVNGTAGSDTINVSGAQVAVNSLLPVNYSNIASLQVNGLAGNNTFNVTSSATVPINIDGGDPASMTPADQLNLNTGLTDTVAFTPGPTSDQGTLQVNSNQPISFAKIVNVTVGGAGAAVIYGTSGNDAITVVARDSSYNASANGVQDFTVSVNGGPVLLFLSTPSLTIHALGGDDQIDVKAPAPNLAAWDETVTVDGGPSSAVGNQLVMAIPGASQATYTPASANSGALAINNSNGLVANVAITNIQSFIDDGQSGGENLTVVGNPAANLFTLKPGSANDAGTLSMDTTLPVAFQNLGTSGQVVVNGNGGADTLLYYGVAANDSFTVASNVLGGQVNLNARVPVITEAIQTLTLQGVAGGDTFTLVPTIAASPYTTLNLQAGNQAAGDQANLTAGAAADVSVSGQVVRQSGNTVAGSGLANINLNGAGNRLVYNGVVGVTENVNVMASSTANQGQISVPGVVLVTFVNVPLIAVNGNAADNDTVTFTGTSNTDVFQINLAAAGTAADPVLKFQTTTGTTLLTLQNYAGFTALNIEGLSGADTFNVYTAATAPGGGRQISINETLPAGKKKLTAVMNVFYVFPKPKIVHSTSTQDPDAGLVSLDYGTAFFLIQFDGIPTVTIRKT
jgi:hypothetical protein